MERNDMAPEKSERGLAAYLMELEPLLQSKASKIEKRFATESLYRTAVAIKLGNSG
jgi:hypothetical protein